MYCKSMGCKFYAGDTFLQDRKGRKQHSALDNDNLKETTEANPQFTIKKLAEQIGVSILITTEHLWMGIKKS